MIAFIIDCLKYTAFVAVAYFIVIPWCYKQAMKTKLGSRVIKLMGG